MRFGFSNLIPVVGARIVRRFSFVHTAIFSLITACIAAMLGFSVAMTGIPTYAASVVWSVMQKGRYWQQVLCTVVWPLCAMVLFLCHPSTAGAGLYAAYWLAVPMLFLCVPRRLHTSAGVCALIASLTAHSVGALLFLFFTPTTPLFWIALIPRVGYERLRLAGAMFLFDCILRFALYNALAWKNRHLHTLRLSWTATVDGHSSIVQPSSMITVLKRLFRNQ